jgi:hypothetical protein
MVLMLVRTLNGIYIWIIPFTLVDLERTLNQKLLVLKNQFTQIDLLREALLLLIYSQVHSRSIEP